MASNKIATEFGGTKGKKKRREKIQHHNKYNITRRKIKRRKQKEPFHPKKATSNPQCT